MSVKEFFDGFKQENFDYQNPDFSNMGSWPLAIRVTTLLIVSFAIVFGFYWFAVKDSQTQLQRIITKEPQLKETYKSKAFQVANLDAFKEQLAKMEEDFGALVSQLPDETDMPSLLDELSTTGAQSGLEIDKITPEDDVVKEFYIETPITIDVRGSYHEMGNFVSSMAAIPRIVTLHDFQMRTTGAQNDSNDAEAPLQMTIKAKTYRYKGEKQ
ncbi:MAG: type 4a pilus biogenesis protein PilO [Reinekea sp.]